MVIKDFIKTDSNREIAFVRSFYDKNVNKCSGIVFLPGFRSDMEGTKAKALEKFCQKNNKDFLKFDYSGHGASSGEFESLCISDWLDDSLNVINALTTGPQILVGSSMGGWISFLLAKKIPKKIKGIVGIAAAPDFTEDGFWNNFSAHQKQIIEKVGYLDIPNQYSEEPYRITKKLIEDGRQNLIFGTTKVFNFPVRLLQGTADKDVKLCVPLKLLEEIECPNMRLTLVQGADHSFSSEECLDLIYESIRAIDKFKII